MFIFIGKSAFIILRIVHFRNIIYFCIKNGKFPIEITSQKSSQERLSKSRKVRGDQNKEKEEEAKGEEAKGANPT